MPGIERGGSRARYCRKRLISPTRCAPGSYRTKSIKKGVKLTICCPKGHFKRGRCQVSTIAQRVLKSKFGHTCPRM